MDQLRRLWRHRRRGRAGGGWRPTVSHRGPCRGDRARRRSARCQAAGVRRRRRHPEERRARRAPARRDKRQDGGRQRLPHGWTAGDARPARWNREAVGDRRAGDDRRRQVAAPLGGDAAGHGVGRRTAGADHGAHRGQHRGDRRSALVGEPRSYNFGSMLLLLLLFVGVLFLVIEAAALVMGADPGAFDHRIGARAVRRHRARARRATSPPDRRCATRDQLGELAESFNSMTAQHRGAAAPGGGEEAARGGTAHRARDPDVAPAAGPARRCRACR